REQGGHRRYSGRPPMSSLEPAPRLTAPALDAELLRVGAKLREVGRALSQRFLGKEELTRLMLVALAAGEHMLLVGPPGTAKSALVRHLARLIDARYFEYLLTRFSEPSELFGPVDIKAFREGTYVRRTEAMLPEAEIAFLDEIFKSNSAILNSLLTVLNERRFFTGSRTINVPLCSLFGATNEIPNDDALSALFDRFLIRARSDNLDSFHFHGLVERGIRAEIAILLGGEALSDVQLFSQLRNLQDIKAALLALGNETSRLMVTEVDKLLEGVFESSRWNG